MPLRGFLYRYTRNEHDALDLAQETFVRLYQHRARYRAGARFSTGCSRLRSISPVPAPAGCAATPPTRWTTGRKPRAPASKSRKADPGSRALGRSAPRREAAVAALPGELREAVVLFEYEERSHAEIAVIVHATPKAVETRLYRARQQLRKTLAKYLV